MIHFFMSSWCGILTDHDHATSQFPLLGVLGFSPPLDKSSNVVEL